MKNRKIRVSMVLMAVLGIVLAMVFVAMASEDSSRARAGFKYPSPPTPFGAAIDISDVIESTGVSSDPVYGTDIYPNGKLLGVYAGQEVIPNLELPLTGDVLWFYAPTIAMGNFNPIEVTTAYWRSQYDSDTQRNIWVWDHSKTAGNPIVSMPINSDFIEKYTAKFPEGQLYFITIMKFNKEWRALLYNFQNKKWDKIYGTKNTSKVVTNGWDSWETKNFNGLCPSVPEVESTQLKVYDKGGFNRSTRVYTIPGWYLVDEKYGKITHAASTGSCNYIDDMVSPYSHWKVSSPSVTAS